MKRHLFAILFTLLSITTDLLGNAVLIVDASSKTVLQLKSSHINVSVTNQVAIVKSRQIFVNQLDSSEHIVYCFPLFEDAAPTALRWKVGGVWYSAAFNPEPQDSALPGSSSHVHADLESYLGSSALHFTPEQAIEPDSLIEFELTYVQLLPYLNNEVNFQYLNDYSLIQSGTIDTQSLSIQVFSDRRIVGSSMLSHPTILNTYTLTNTEVLVELINEAPDLNYEYRYQLDPEDLGLFDFSYYLPDSISYCDTFGRGYFGFIVEPDPGDSLIIAKTFTLIIDQSGSMATEKMEQAKEAASYIVNNLNALDQFNIIAFDTYVSSLYSDHRPFNTTNQVQALDYIESLEAGGMTNISGSFETAIPQFESADDDEFNIIIFLTDGVATAGETNTDSILNIIENLIHSNEVEGLSINTFGIGSAVNESLLSQIAAENNGLVSFFEDGDLLEVVTDFYAKIKDPVLINTTLSFDPPLVTEVFPSPLPNLYKGQQLVVSGRYNVPDTVEVTFSGEKFGLPISYVYTVELTDSAIEQNAFLTKLWAISKINSLMQVYYTLGDLPAVEDSLYQYITELSICYSLVTPLVSFMDDSWTDYVDIMEWQRTTSTLKASSYPNPFESQTTIHFNSSFSAGLVPIVILDMEGRIIRILDTNIYKPGDYQIIWDGLDESGNKVNTGIYPYYIQLGEQKLIGVMQRI